MTDTKKSTHEYRPSAETSPLDVEEQTTQPLSFWEMLTSTLWAVLGVQNSKNRERDFSRGKAIHFIYFGIGFTVLFVIGMILLVRLVLSQVG